MFYNNYHYNESQIHSFLSFAFTLSSHSFHLFAQFLLPRVQTHSLSTSSFGNLSFLCSALGSPLHFFLIRASFSPPLCSALVSGGLRVDLVRQMVWEWQRDRKARRRGGGEEREQTAVPGVSWSRSSKKYLIQCHPFPCATRDRNKKLTWNWAQIGGVLRWLLVLPRHYSGLQ